MAVVLGALAVGLVMLIAAVVILRESRRLASLPPRPVFDIDEALDWVVQHIADHAAATLTVDDVREIIEIQLQYFRSKGVSGNGASPHPLGPAGHPAAWMWGPHPNPVDGGGPRPCRASRRVDVGPPPQSG